MKTEIGPLADKARKQNPPPATRTRLSVLSSLVGLTLTATTLPAWADLRLCNKTDSTISVAIGYKANDGWRSEGWWNIGAAKCGTLLSGALASRYYYFYAVDSQHGGEWGGKAYMCTRRKMFTIAGVENCVARGYERTGFFEVDTAEQRSWTVHLYQPTQKGTSVK
jgi:uncharacterized membrane protein